MSRQSRCGVMYIHMYLPNGDSKNILPLFLTGF